MEADEPTVSLYQLLPPVIPQPGGRYVPSQFAFPLVCNGKRYVYHTLTKQLMETALPSETRVGEGFDPLIEGRFLVPEDQDECALYQTVFAMMRTFRLKKNHSFVILPTLACNARCVYCYEEGMPQTTMSPETAEQTIRYIIQSNPEGEIRLSWFGGEPMLRPDIIDRICEGLKEAGVRYYSSAISNGSLITPEIIEKMKGLWNLKRIQISMDGNEQDYIDRKRYPVYHDYYHAVMETINRLSEAGIRVTIRCNVDNANIDHMSSILDDLAACLRHKDKVTLYYEPLFGESYRENDVALWKKIVDFHPQIEAAGFRSIPEIRLKDDLEISKCMADSGGTVITPDGSLYPCEHLPKGAQFGDVWHGVTNEAARNAFARTDRIREDCKHCTFLPICTPYAYACPVKNTIAHCREIVEHKLTDALRQQIRKKDTGEPEEPITC